MPSTDTPLAESTPVQLTRMEGVLNLIGYKVTDLVIRVDRHDRDINELKLSTQQLGADAIARDATVVATAKALRDAKEAAEANTRAEHMEKEKTWAPLTKLFAIAGFGLVVLNIFQFFLPV